MVLQYLRTAWQACTGRIIAWFQRAEDGLRRQSRQPQTLRQWGKSVTERLQPDQDGIARAAELLREGACVAFPTETVYGLGADALNDRAVAGVFAAKDRPTFNPLIAHVANTDAARELVNFNDAAKRLAAAFWPGPLTLVLPMKPGGGVSPLVTAGLDTLAVRIPAHALAQELLSAAGVPVAAPSANPSGRVSPTTADHVLDGLAGRIAAVLDGGPCDVGLESTIIGLSEEPTLLRPGGLPTEAIETCLGTHLKEASQSDAPTAPGQLASHYAPKGRLRLNATAARAGEVLIGFGDVRGNVTLSASGDLTEAAANLFRILRQMDADGVTHIAVAPIPGTGLGRAINDRLHRAAAPRTS